MTARSVKSGVKSAKSGVKQRCGGLFSPDPDVPADPLDQAGLSFCLCGLRGKPGDAHHALPDAPLDDVQRRAAGERSER